MQIEIVSRSQLGQSAVGSHLVTRIFHFPLSPISQHAFSLFLCIFYTFFFAYTAIVGQLPSPRSCRRNLKTQMDF